MAPDTPFVKLARRALRGRRRQLPFLVALIACVPGCTTLRAPRGEHVSFLIYNVNVAAPAPLAARGGAERAGRASAVDHSAEPRSSSIASPKARPISEKVMALPR